MFNYLFLSPVLDQNVIALFSWRDGTIGLSLAQGSNFHSLMMEIISMIQNTNTRMRPIFLFRFDKLRMIDHNIFKYAEYRSVLKIKYFYLDASCLFIVIYILLETFLS